MAQTAREGNIFDDENIWRILFQIAPPVMLAQLIQALYNIVDSYFVGQYSEAGLTALSVIFPVQFVIIALAIGTGVGVNTYMARLYAYRRYEEADRTAGTGMVLAVLMWAVFALLSLAALRPYVEASAKSPEAVEAAMTYGTIVCVGSLGMFLESNWTKVHQAVGNMKLPMAAQIAGALTNIVLDPILIFGWGPAPQMGIAGAAWATVAGQFVAAAITGVKGCRRPPALAQQRRYAAAIYKLGIPSILMQMTVTLYIVALNIILAGFSDEAVTILGLYYKIQTFFFIPLLGLQTCIVPALSYNYGRGEYGRTRAIFRDSMLASMALMLVGIFCFEFMPQTLLGLFSRNEIVLTQGARAFRIIALSFIPTVAALLLPVFFQAIGQAFPSILLSLTRQIFCLIPIFYVLSRIGLDYVWFAFPIAEVITGSVGAVFYFRLVRQWKNL